MIELNNVFYSLKGNERPDCDDIIFNVIQKMLRHFAWNFKTFFQSLKWKW